MAKPAPDERVVYLALKNVLQGPERRSKTVKQIIQKNQARTEIADLIREYDADKVCSIAKSLLADRVFESTLIAKLRFPEVFEVSPGQAADRSISELAAARNEDAAIQDVIQGRQVDPSSMEPEVLAGGEVDGQTARKRMNDCMRDVKREMTTVAEHVPDEGSQFHDTALKTASTSLYPVYLPFDVQHRLLTKVQAMLERACFVFAKRNIVGVLVSEGWDCAESGELNLWSKIFMTHSTAFDTVRVEQMGRPFAEVMSTMADLRHAAVHRLRFSATRVKQFLNDAVLLVKLLNIDDYTSEICAIRRKTQGAIEDIERNKDLLELQMAEMKRQYAAKRAELDRQEAEEVDNALTSDIQYATLAGRSLELALSTPATVIYSPNTTEDESCSDLEADCVSSEEAEMCGKCAGD